MSNKEHSHWDLEPIKRIVPEKYLITNDKMLVVPEKLQLICVQCGGIFREMKIKDIATDSM